MFCEINDLLISANVSVKDAMRKLDKTAEKILFVADEKRHLIGSITDGDIRRWILSEGKVDDCVNDVCFRNTFCVLQNTDVELIKEEIKKRKITHVPVLDKDGKIVNVIARDKLFDVPGIHKTKGKLEIPIVIMAGGRGTRLDPFTRILPKPLIPIGEKSLIEIIIERFLEYRINQFYITVNHKAKILKSFFEELEPEYLVKFIYENKPLGTAGSLRYLQGEIDGVFLLTNCDIIIKAEYDDIYAFHKNNQFDITLVASMKHYNIPYGVCEIENGGLLTQINEKPSFNFLVNTGMYFINSNLLKYIPEDQIFHMTDMIETVKKRGGRIGVYPISEDSWIDTGEWAEYNKALEAFKH